MAGLRVRLVVGGLSVGLLLAAGAGATPALADRADRHGSGHYWAKIQRASYGVPHITAASFAGLGFGVGRVQAEDNICIIAGRIVTADAGRAVAFGVSGPTDPNIRSDLFFQKAKDDR